MNHKNKFLSILLTLFFALFALTVSAQQRRPVDSKHPMWLIHIDVWNNADPQKIIDLIPEDVRPYVCFNLSLSCQYDTEKNVYKMPQNAVPTYKSWASVCCANNVWFTCQPASGGHTHIQDGDLDTFEYFFKHYKNFLGWNYAEQFWGFDEPNDKSSSTQASRIALFAKLVPMHHKYGGMLIISFCGNIWSHPLNPIGMMKRNSALLNACKKYPEACLWLYKYTTSSCFYNNESVTLAPFISGLAKNYGVRYDNCGWNGALEAILGKDNGKKYPNSAGYGTVMEQTCINGGAVWDGPELIWTEDFQERGTTNVNGYTRRNWGTYKAFDNGWLDMFRKIIDGTLYIPSREEVVQRTKVVIINDNNSGNDEQKYASIGDLYDGLYKQKDPFNRGNGQWMDNFCYFKKTGRYQAIPVVIDCYDELSKSIPVKVKRSQYSSRWSSQARKVQEFDKLYEEVSTGDLYVARHKNELVTYYPFTYFRKATTASASIPLRYNTCESLDLEYSKFGNGIVHEYADRIDLYLNNYRMDTTLAVVDKVTIHGATAKPEYTYQRRANATGGAPTETWDAETGTYELSIRHMGPVEVSIKCAGNGTDRQTDLVADTPLELPQQPEEYYGELVKEAENIDYRNIKSCVTNPYAWYPNVRGHAAMGFVDMGTNTAASLRDSVFIKHPGEYTISVRYMLTSNTGSMVTTLNGKSSALRFAKTNSNEWKEASFTAELKEGGNSFVLRNSSGLNIYIDQVIYTPADQHNDVLKLDIAEAEDGDVPSGWVASEGGVKTHPDNGSKALAWSGAAPSLTYGTLSDYPFSLEEGDYKLTLVNNKALETADVVNYTVSIEDEAENVVASEEKMATDDQTTMTFSIAKAGNYVLRLSGAPNMEYLLSKCVVIPTYLYTVNILDSEGGKATVGASRFEAGEQVDLEVEVEEGYDFVGWDVVYGGVSVRDNSFVMPERSVTLRPIFKDQSLVYALDFSSTLSGTLPPGWQAVQENNDTHSYPNSYTSGGRTFVGFTGYQGAALYWREGYAEYGRQSSYRLKLEPGWYQFSFCNAAWKGTPSYKAQILKSDGSVLAQSDAYRSTPNANGSTSANLTSAKTYEFTFEVTESGNYIIRFQNQGDMGGGFEEFLLLMCKISKAEDPNLGNGINDAPAAEATVTAIYNLSGVRTDKMSPGVNIVRMSDGTTRKVYVK